MPQKDKVYLSEKSFSGKSLTTFAVVFALLASIYMYNSYADNPNLTADINNDNKVDITDMSLLLSAYGISNSNSDLNDDGVVNILDLSILLTNYNRTYTPPQPPPPNNNLLAFRPPALTSPTTIEIYNTAGSKRQSLDPLKDYILICKEKLTNNPGLWIMGGRNVILKGCEVTMDVYGNNEGYWDYTAVKIRDSDPVNAPAAGHVFVEGLKVTGNFTYDGIALAAPKKTITLQNINVANKDAPNSGFHEDCIQNQAGVAVLQIDKLTCSTVLQGIITQNSTGSPAGFLDLRRANFNGSPGKHLLFIDEASTRVALSDVWLNLAQPWAAWGYWQYPQQDCRTYSGSFDYSRCAVVSTNGASLTFTQGANITGKINKGNPPTGDFVPANVPGLNYLSPGYK